MLLYFVGTCSQVNVCTVASRHGAQKIKGLTLCIFPGKREELETLIHEEFDSAEHEVLCVCLGKQITLLFSCFLIQNGFILFPFSNIFFTIKSDTTKHISIERNQSRLRRLFSSCSPKKNKVDPGSVDLSRTCKLPSHFRDFRIRSILKNQILFATKQVPE